MSEDQVIEEVGNSTGGDLSSDTHLINAMRKLVLGLVTSKGTVLELIDVDVLKMLVLGGLASKGIVLE